MAAFPEATSLSTKAAFIDHLRHGLGTPQPAPRHPSSWHGAEPPAVAYSVPGGRARMRAVLDSLGATMWETPNAQVGVVVTEIIAGRRPVLCGPGVDHLPGIPEVLRWPECGTAGAASAAIAVVWARAAATQTGSVLLDSASGRGRSASLLPPAVVFLVPADALVETPGDILRHPQRWFDERLPSQVLLVTGPSRSADIEMTLTRGVHGPGEVHVVVVDR